MHASNALLYWTFRLGGIESGTHMHAQAQRGKEENVHKPDTQQTQTFGQTKEDKAEESAIDCADIAPSQDHTMR
jgi:hypothetical protein